ncbi:hypothetical protein ACFOUP_18945 [Belliella kenyensis]|uniref:Surface antigen n=1 Tax=Belliella kenyensis TaxID=1472724 RepID=A0ABV8ET04_9BACT|nr:hypothetical protein [Belliella kenyensis]MCH7402145.1 hypothetical protein [Belliella kenyensis]MDN3601660.1 hypothetical protein [Belliella kenyensis]
MRKLLFICVFLIATVAVGQKNEGNRSTLYFTQGYTGANLRLFNEMLASKGLSPMRKGYSNLGLGYQTRYNDFILGVELFQNAGRKSTFYDYDIDYRTTRAMINVGYALTEEGRFQFIHYMSVGTGFMNFQMLRERPNDRISEFLSDPAQGYILREGNIHKGSRYFSGFLTEIGFQMSYDLDIPGREEVLEIMTKFGYSFSPFEEAWDLNGVKFGNIQSGAFIRVGAGISLPDRNFFYRDASISAQLLTGFHFTAPNRLNEALESNGYSGFDGRPNNWGLKILGDSKGWLYGMDVYNLGLNGKADDTYSHTLNSVRLYGNAGYKFYDRRNVEIGALTGLGYGNLRYTLSNDSKPDFPRLFEEPDFDGQLRARGLMGKPELYIAYGLPLSKTNMFNLIFSVHGGYEVPLGRYKLADIPMYQYMGNSYLHFTVGIRP